MTDRLLDDIPSDLLIQLRELRDQAKRGVVDPQELARKVRELIPSLQDVQPAALERMAVKLRTEVVRADRALPKNPRDRQAVLGILLTQSFRSIADLGERRLLAETFVYTLLGGLGVGFDDDEDEEP